MRLCPFANRVGRSALFVLLLSLDAVRASAQDSPQAFASNSIPETVKYGPFTTLRTEPTIFYHTPNVTIHTDEADNDAHYIFYNPRTLFARQFGPQIIDQRDGSLVWYGNETVPAAGTMGFQPCDFDTGDASPLAKRHLCITQVQYVEIDDTRIGLPVRKALASSSVLSDAYQLVYTAGKEEAARQVDILSNPASTAEQWPGTASIPGPHEEHEFHMLPGGKSYLTIVMRPRPWNLRAYAPAPPSHERLLELEQGTVMDACFQEIPTTAATRRGEPLFSWCALDAYPDIDFWRPHVFFDGPDPEVDASDGRYRDGAGGRGNDAWGWDLFRPNSIDTDGDGNYIVSLRHIDAVILVAGPHSATVNPKTGSAFRAGELIWRLDGAGDGDFDMVDATTEAMSEDQPENSNSTLPARQVDAEQKRQWEFGRQHHASRLASMSNDTHLVISLFDNGWTDRKNREGLVSAALVVSLAKPDRSGPMTATLLSRYSHLSAQGADRAGHAGGDVSLTLGSAQVLPSGNMLVGWGSVPEMTEFNRRGDPVWHMRFGPEDSSSEMLTYRAIKDDWVGRPEAPPKLVVYGPSCGSVTNDDEVPNESPKFTAYVSWNGATEVSRWRFWTHSVDEQQEKTSGHWWPFPSSSAASALSTLSGGWKQAGTARKQGFETRFIISSFGTLLPPTGVIVEALDSTDRVLAASDPVRVFVPLARLVAAGRCDDEGCICREDDLEGCTTNGPEKHFIYSDEMSEQCDAKTLSDLSAKGGALHDGTQWTQNNTKSRAADGKFVAMIWFLVGLMAAAFVLSKLWSRARSAAIVSTAKAFVFAQIRAIRGAWTGRRARTRYASVPLHGIR